jgi:hypothetical protein
MRLGRGRGIFGLGDALFIWAPVIEGCQRAQALVGQPELPFSGASCVLGLQRAWAQPRTDSRQQRSSTCSATSSQFGTQGRKIFGFRFLLKAGASAARASHRAGPEGGLLGPPQKPQRALVPNCLAGVCRTNFCSTRKWGKRTLGAGAPRESGVRPCSAFAASALAEGGVLPGYL